MSTEDTTPAAVRERLEAALDASIDRCPRCKVCDTQIGAAMTVLGPLLERAERAEARLAEARQVAVDFRNHHAGVLHPQAEALYHAVLQVIDREPLKRGEEDDRDG